MADEDEKSPSGVSRREFLKISGIAAAVPLVAPQVVEAAGEKVPVYGPGKVPMSFTINGKKYSAQLEPRVTVLAIEAQHEPITTIESLSENGKLHPIQAAFVEHDAQQCGFCTPGFVMACKAFLDEYPHPTAEQIRYHLNGNLCRCGTYKGIREVIAQMSGTKGA